MLDLRLRLARGMIPDRIRTRVPGAGDALELAIRPAADAERPAGTLELRSVSKGGSYRLAHTHPREAKSARGGRLKQR